MASSESTRVINAALVGNLLVALTKAAAAAITGSSAMMSEALHSVVDTGNELLLLYGLRKAARPPDADHPFGHGREVYFWSFIVALLIFSLGALASIYQGVLHIRSPATITNPFVNYVVLALALVFEGGAWSVALKQFRAAKGDLGYLEAVRQSKDPTTFLVLAEDTGAIIGILIALAGTVAAEVLDLPVLDGVASVAIGILLGVIALVLGRETKGLLIGEPARSELVDSICKMARAEPGIQVSNGLFTVHVGPRQVVAALSVDFKDTLSALEVERIIAALEDRVRKAHPEVVSLLIKPQKPERADFQEQEEH
ncbi:MAG TPA: cation diffusion facilitator family transporter [Candidatus Polarisedimenticolia bacterium]|jgi:cation diffusion facilitator family transporter